jgi:coproporphyrinogen III oxidase-like Fe-S oxidoreductase
LPKYVEGKRIADESVQVLTEKDFLIEKFFLGLRTDRGVGQLSDFVAVLVDDWEEKVALYEKEGFIRMREKGLVLTDRGMDCYNGIVTELLKEI